MFVIALLALLAFGFSSVAPASATSSLKPSNPPVPNPAPPITTINGSPLTISINPMNLAMAVAYEGRQQFYDGFDGGTFVGFDGLVFGSSPSGSYLNPYPFIPFSQSPVTGTGTAADPFQMTTSVWVGEMPVRLTQVTSYVNGDLRYRMDFTVQVITPDKTDEGFPPITLFHGADLDMNFPGNTLGEGYGVYENGIVGERSEDRQYLAGFQAISPPAEKYMEADYALFWDAIGTDEILGPGFDNTVDSEYGDGGAGLQWTCKLDEPAPYATSCTISMYGVFGPVPLEKEKEKEKAAADIYIVQRPTPNYGVGAGEIVEYEVEVSNRGLGSAKNVVLKMPFDPAILELLDAVSDDGAWVTEVGDGYLIIKTPGLGARNDKAQTVAKIKIKIRFRVREGIALWTPLANRITFEWKDSAKNGKGSSNITMLIVAEANDQREALPMSVDPAAGPVGTVFTFTSQYFLPREPITVWYNTPEGSVSAGPTYKADEDGNLIVTFSNEGLEPGTYSMVFRGNWSELTMTVPFVIE
ncbi:hypothetical protein OSCT_2636 [Oscillochloris trichoides DG-6]|uniref:DUF11 domain-containing protein n=1 Tax=Oscillochloris trichoides DG-6 TaxID=765420 RepID=E1IH35_9CHLR|nr:hypothetical protein OSCT_2636 [Oscillochloris trichoides DG-6]